MVLVNQCVLLLLGHAANGQKLSDTRRGHSNGEVANMASPCNLPCPSAVRILNGVVDLDRKQHRPSPLVIPFLFQCSLYFVFNPLAFDET